MHNVKTVICLSEKHPPVDFTEMLECLIDYSRQVGLRELYASLVSSSQGKGLIDTVSQLHVDEEVRQKVNRLSDDKLPSVLFSLLSELVLRDLVRPYYEENESYLIHR